MKEAVSYLAHSSRPVKDLLAKLNERLGERGWGTLSSSEDNPLKSALVQVKLDILCSGHHLLRARRRSTEVAGLIGNEEKGVSEEEVCHRCIQCLGNYSRAIAAVRSSSLYTESHNWVCYRWSLFIVHRSRTRKWLYLVETICGSEGTMSSVGFTVFFTYKHLKSCSRSLGRPLHNGASFFGCLPWELHRWRSGRSEGRNRCWIASSRM